MNTVAISIGSNIEPDANVKRACDLLSHYCEVVKTSAFVTTKPIGYANQPDFVNGAVLVKTSRSPENLTSLLHALERKLGRTRTTNKFGPRTIDLDILAWNGMIVDRDYYSRGFLINALQEIWPELNSHG
ncbi:MAG: 2-amino-4-hydroxy-6-hydroxymethyldihydropteridine diphosphokinase [Chitinivibrionales bacterium]|nr:2-amino-4-hydroxy-6-hydroxymethyldihydropteridine diphosphokinase [Chitinivibrionales bacterium]